MICTVLQHGNTALHEAAWNGYSKTLELLAKNRASTNVINKAGFSPLHLAVQNGHNQSARVLLYAGTNGDQKNNVSRTFFLFLLGFFSASTLQQQCSTMNATFHYN